MKQTFANLIFAMVLLGSATPSVILNAQTVQNSSFETPVVGLTNSFYSFEFDPGGDAWTFSGNAGIAANGSGFMWYAPHPGTQYGNQFAFLQGALGVGGTVSQTISISSGGEYAFTFNASLRQTIGTEFQTQTQSVTVLVDGVNVGTFSPPDTNWYVYQTAPIPLSSGNHILTFTNFPAPGDATVFIDMVNCVQPFALLHSFGSSSGSLPYDGLVLVGNTLCGTTEYGGSFENGVVFSIQTDGTAYTVLHTFTTLVTHTINPDGANPQAGLIFSGNILYGTADQGGTGSSIGWGWGTVFAVNTNGTGFTTLHSFTYTGSDGSTPLGQLALSGSTLYGTTADGGNLSVNNGLGYGTIFDGNINGSGFATLYSFSGSDGKLPTAGLVLSGNTLYGTTSSGGANNDGTVFAINLDGSGFTTLHSFANGDGTAPHSGLILANNTLYGTASQGGNGGDGTVFSLGTDGSAFRVLHAFSYSDGAAPYAALVLSNNILYGTTSQGGGGGDGTVFSINDDGTGFTMLHAFAGSDGATPYSALVLSGNMLYGTTYSGGTNYVGTIFALSAFPTPPYIINEPSDLVVTDSYPATFSVVASGTPVLSYQWQKNGVNLSDSGNISGSGTNTLTISAASFSDSAQYQLVIANGFGSITSDIVSLSVLPFPPNIEQQPAPSLANVIAGSSPIYSIGAIGAPPLNYQWYVNGIAIAGATSSSLQIQNTTTNQSGNYSAVVTNIFGAVTSTPAILNVFNAPAIISQTTNFSTVYGVTNTLSVVATGTAIQYQWFFNSTAIPGGTNSSLTLTGGSGGGYYVVISNPVASVKSQSIEVSVFAALRLLPTGNWPGVYPANGYWPNVPMVYTIEAGATSGTIDYAIQEQISGGNGSSIIVSNISDGGTFNANTATINWGPFFDDSPRTLTYALTPSSGATNWLQFSGIISINGANSIVAGGNEINLLPLDPADNGGDDSLPIDNFISINEMTAYADAWKYDTLWAVVPNPIPISYVTSAGVIWKQGEYYIYNSNLGAPPACWVNAVPPQGAVQQAIISKPIPSIKINVGEANPLDDSSSTAVCSMPNIYTNTVPFTVSITVTPASSVGVYAMQDQIPVGWAATNFSDSGAFDSINNEVKFGPFFDNSTRTLTYQIIAPTNSTGTVTLLGMASFDGIGIPITGVRQAVSNSTPPAFQQILHSRAGLVLTWSVVPTLSYQLQYSTNLTSKNWINVGSVLTGTNSSMTSTNDIGSSLQGFYRILLIQ